MTAIDAIIIIIVCCPIIILLSPSYNIVMIEGPQDTHGGSRPDGSQPNLTNISQIHPQQDQAEAGGAVPTVLYRHIPSGKSSIEAIIIIIIIALFQTQLVVQDHTAQHLLDPEPLLNHLQGHPLLTYLQEKLLLKAIVGLNRGMVLAPALIMNLIIIIVAIMIVCKNLRDDL